MKILGYYISKVNWKKRFELSMRNKQMLEDEIGRIRNSCSQLRDKLDECDFEIYDLKAKLKSSDAEISRLKIIERKKNERKKESNKRYRENRKKRKASDGIDMDVVLSKARLAGYDVEVKPSSKAYYYVLIARADNNQREHFKTIGRMLEFINNKLKK